MGNERSESNQAATGNVVSASQSTPRSNPLLAAKNWPVEEAKSALGDVAVNGVVLDATTGGGVANVSVMIQAEKDEQLTRIVTTSHDGAFALRVPYFEGERETTWRVFPLHRNYFVPHWYAPIPVGIHRVGAAMHRRVGAGAEEAGLRFQIDPENLVPRTLTIHLERGAQIVGRVVDTEGNPIAGATMLVHLDHRHAIGHALQMYSPWKHSPPIVTHEDGHFVLGHIPTSIATFQLAATHPKWVAGWQGPFDSSLHSRADIVMQRAATLELALLGAARSRVGIKTRGVGRWANCESTEFSDIGQSAIIQRVPPGDVVATARFYDAADTSKTIEIHVLIPGERRRVLFPLSEYHEIRGSLVSADGQPIAEESIELRLRGDRRVVGKSYTGDAGEFSFGGIGNEGPYSLWLVTTNRSEKIMDDVTWGQRHRVITTPTGSSTTRIRVVDSQGKFRESARFRLMGLNNEDVNVRNRQMSPEVSVHPPPGGNWSMSCIGRGSSTRPRTSCGLRETRMARLSSLKRAIRALAWRTSRPTTHGTSPTLELPGRRFRMR